MSGLIAGLLEGIFDFITDVWVVRRQRAHRNRPQNDWSKDASEMVVFDIWTWLVSALAFAVFALMFFVLALPLWISLAPVVAGAVYVGYRWMAMVRA